MTESIQILTNLDFKRPFQEILSKNIKTSQFTVCLIIYEEERRYPHLGQRKKEV